MKRHLLLFAALLLPCMVKAQSIEVFPDTLSFEYAEGHGASIQSFIVTHDELLDSLHISFFNQNQLNLKFQLSKSPNEGFENSISFTLDELSALGNQVEVFVRMNDNLLASTYEDTIVIASEDVETKEIQCIGIVNGAVAIPQFTLPEGTYHGQQTVSINCDTEGAIIYYTTNGEDPNDSSAVYELNEEILIDRTTTLKAVGIKENWNNSDTASATYLIQYHIRADVSPEGSGYIIYNGHCWTYFDNYFDTNVDSITLQADPKPNYSFEYWKDNNGEVVSYNSQYVIPIDRDYALTAEFKINNGIINYSVLPQGAGNITIGGSQEIGQTATLTAIPEECYRFKQWNDGTTSNPLEFIVGETNNYTAIFELEDYTIIGNSNNEEWGSVTGGDNNFHCEEVATLEAIPEEGYEFEKWEDGNTDNPRQIVVNGNATLEAIFSPIIKEPDPICSGESLTLENPLIGGEWQLSSDFDFGNFIPYDNQPLDASYNGWYLRYHYRWYSFEWDSNIVQITVNSVGELNIEGNESASVDQEVEYEVTIDGDNNYDNYSFDWNVSDEQASTISTENHVKVTWKTTGEQQISVTVTDKTTRCSASSSKTITVNACIEDLQTIVPKYHHTTGNDSVILILVYPNPADTYQYQWYRDDNEIPGATDQYYYQKGGLDEGVYTVKLSLGDDCFRISNPYSVNQSRHLRIYPNPSYRDSNIVVEKGCDGQARLNIFSTDGRLLHTQTLTDDQATIGISLPQGVYVAYLTDSEGYTKVCKLIIQ